MSAPASVLVDLRSVVRIAKAASIGVAGNKARIERAEQAIAATEGLINALDWALERIRSAGLGEGEKFAAAEAVLVKAVHS